MSPRSETSLSEIWRIPLAARSARSAAFARVVGTDDVPVSASETSRSFRHGSRSLGLLRQPRLRNGNALLK